MEGADPLTFKKGAFFLCPWLSECQFSTNIPSNTRKGTSQTSRPPNFTSNTALLKVCVFSSKLYHTELGVERIFGGFVDISEKDVETKYVCIFFKRKRNILPIIDRLSLTFFVGEFL